MGTGTSEEVKKSQRARNSSRKRFTLPINSNSWSDSLKPSWKDVPLSNFDLLNWVKFLKIPDFKGIFSRDSKDHLHREGCCIINLDDEIGQGSHWVSHSLEGKNVFYFDSFSLPPPLEFVEYTEKTGKKIIWNGGHPIQDICSVRCGYYCLYFLKEIQR